ncbi:MAG TPA: fluoride efflux transporter CrcB [Longimicrobiales bacterium]|nr:fluoride efflux transporter CrcB [Longimicrobiales bacterium]
MILLYIALGGALGAVARYGVGGWVQARAGFGFPWGTLAVNVAGALLIGFAMRYLAAVRLSPEVRALIIIGGLGAFTTFSTFSYETVALLEDGEWLRAGMYATASLVLGLLAVYAGSAAAGWVLQVRG